MIAMGMSNEDVAHGLAADRREQCCQMLVIVGTWIDDRDFARSDDVARRALEGERPWIIGKHAPDERRQPVRAAGHCVESAIECQGHRYWSATVHRPALARLL